MPHIYREKPHKDKKTGKLIDKQRYEYRRRWPRDVKPAIGKDWFIYKFPQHVTEAMANELSHVLNIKRQEICAAVRANRPVPVLDMRGYKDAIMDGRKPAAFTSGPFSQSRVQMMPASTEGLIEVGGGTYVLNDDEPNLHNDMMKVVTLDQAIGYWKKRHGPFRDAAAEKKAEAAKRRAVGSLFKVAGTTDMAAIDTLTIQNWKDGLTDPRQAHDFISDIKTLYKRLDANNRLMGGNPCVKPNGTPAIELPPKPEHAERGEFSPERAKLILESARASDDPLIKWGQPIMAFTGMIVSEFVYGPTSEIKFNEQGVWVWHVGEKRKLKTGHRSRVLPLHQRLLDLGFLDFVGSRGDGLLFDANNTQASARLMAHLRDPDGLNIQGADQCNYSWRHGFISQLVAKGTDPTLRRYLDGHGLGHIDEKHYIHHHMPEMVKAISALHDPLVHP
jgi:hypothetical protein